MEDNKYQNFENFADMLWLSQYIKVQSKEKDISSFEDVQIEDYEAEKECDELEDEAIEEQEEDILSEHAHKTQQSKEIHVNDEEKRTVPEAKKRSASAFKSPKKLALSHYRAWEKAFKFINLKRPSKNRYEIDENKTVENIAATNIVDLTFRNIDEKFFSLTVIVDRSESMELWSELIKNFEQMLYTMGVFTRISIYYWDTRTKNPILYVDKSLKSKIQENAIVGDNHHNLIWVMSDCISTAWKSGESFKSIAEWSKRSLTSIIHMFPKEMWVGTMLFKGTPTHFSSRVFHPLNKQLISHSYRSRDENLKIPVISFDPYALQSWAQVVVNSRDNMISGIELGDLNFNYRENVANKEMSAKKRLDRFYAHASDIAKKLVSYMSVLPVDFQVTRILQEVKLPQSNQSHVAEVYLGGLIEKIVKDEKIAYDFYSGVREELDVNIGVDEAFELMENMSGFVSSHLNVGVDFSALIVDPAGAISGDYELDEQSIAFARLASNIMKRKGGLFYEKAMKIEQGLSAEIEKDIESRLTGIKTGVLNKEVEKSVDHSEISLRALVREKLIILGWQEEDIIEAYKVENTDLVFDILLKDKDNFLASIIVENNLKNNKIQDLLPMAKQLNIDFLYLTNMKNIYEYDSFNVYERQIDNLPSKDILLEQCKQSYTKRIFIPDHFYVENLRTYQKQAVSSIQKALITKKKRIIVSLLDDDRINVIIEILLKMKSLKDLSIQKDINEKKVLVLCSSRFLYKQIVSSSKEYALYRDIDIIYLYDDVEVSNRTQNGQYDLVIFDQASIVLSKNTLHKSLMQILKDATYLAFTDNYNTDIDRYFGRSVYEYTLADSITDGYSLQFDIQTLNIEKGRFKMNHRHLIDKVNTILKNINLNEKTVIIYEDDNLAKSFEQIVKKKKEYITYSIKKFTTDIVPTSFLLLHKNKIMGINNIDNIVFLAKVEKDMIWRILKGAAKKDYKNESRERVKIIDLYENRKSIESIIKKNSDYNDWLNKKIGFRKPK